MGLTQVVIQLCCFTCLVSSFYQFYPSTLKNSSGWYLAKEAYNLMLLGTILMISIFLLALSLEHNTAQFIGSIFGLIAGVTSLFQFIPQIIETCKSRRIGSLSLQMLCIQCPGSFLFAFTISRQPGSNISSWATFAIGGILQLVLILVCLLWVENGRIHLEEDAVVQNIDRNLEESESVEY